MFPFRNWIKLINLEDGSVIYQNAIDFSDSTKMHNVRLPINVLDMKAVSRELNFSTIEELKNFRIVHNAKFKGKLFEQMNFSMGSVKAGTTNTWISKIEAATESQMMPAKVLNGKVTIETEFYDEDEKFATSMITLFFD
jgi:retinal rod rhodopsin-sensitive cGMP 3',5'-cyclic phosphodiesterase subunit delta